MSSSQIAVITMVRNGDIFAQKWIEYYSQCFGAQNLFLILDGEDQKTPPNAGDINIIVKTHTPLPRASGDAARAKFISDFAQDILKSYHAAIATDIDEFIAVDPRTNKTLKDYLLGIQNHRSISSLGLDVIPFGNCNAPLSWTKPVLQQRYYARLNSRYTKASIIFQPAQWGSGFHRVRRQNFHIDPALYLFHLGMADTKPMMNNQSREELLTNDWGMHMMRRKNEVISAQEKQPADGDRLFSIARFQQTYLRLATAWNKPGSSWPNPVIEIPQRFRNIL